jgi:hypothetical protein
MSFLGFLCPTFNAVFVHKLLAGAKTDEAIVDKTYGAHGKPRCGHDFSILTWLILASRFIHRDIFVFSKYISSEGMRYLEACSHEIEPLI